jgi:hypothetical protein
MASSDIHIRPRSRKNTATTITTISSLPPPPPPTHQQQQQQPQGPQPPTTAHLSAGSWTVTYSTLPMWRNKRNVKITYSPLPTSSKSPYKHPPPKEGAAATTTETRLSDLVTYQTLKSTKIKSIRGIDKPTPGPALIPDPESHPTSTQPPSPKSPFRSRLRSLLLCSRPTNPRTPTPNAWTYTWRGTTFLKPITSDWEILGYGTITTTNHSYPTTSPPIKHDWLLTYFSKTRLSPAGVDICFRERVGWGTGGAAAPLAGDDETSDRRQKMEPPAKLIAAIKQKLEESEDDVLRNLGAELFRVEYD